MKAALWPVGPVEPVLLPAWKKGAQPTRQSIRWPYWIQTVIIKRGPGDDPLIHSSPRTSETEPGTPLNHLEQTVIMQVDEWEWTTGTVRCQKRVIWNQSPMKLLHRRTNRGEIWRNQAAVNPLLRTDRTGRARRRELVEETHVDESHQTRV